MPNLASQSLTRLSTLAVSLPAKVFTFITSPSYLESLVNIPFNRPPGEMGDTLDFEIAAKVKNVASMTPPLSQVPRCEESE